MEEDKGPSPWIAVGAEAPAAGRPIFARTRNGNYMAIQRPADWDWLVHKYRITHWMYPPEVQWQPT